VAMNVTTGFELGDRVAIEGYATHGTIEKAGLVFSIRSVDATTAPPLIIAESKLTLVHRGCSHKVQNETGSLGQDFTQLAINIKRQWGVAEVRCPLCGEVLVGEGDDV
jgi:hypothetical protein